MTMTAPAPAGHPAPPRRQQLERATQLATGALTRIGRGRVPERGTAEAFGRALAGTHPRSPHGQLLTAALQVRPWADRTLAERVCHWLARRGETPTARAVASRLEQAGGQEQRAEERQVLTKQLAERDGLRAAVYVAGIVRDTGAGPTWRELGRAMGWPGWAVPWVVGQLERDGWLTTGPAERALRPGRGAEP
jgi:hypothetical protein